MSTAAYFAAYREKHREKARQATREWREQNYDRHLENNRRWKRANPDKRRTEAIAYRSTPHGNAVRRLNKINRDAKAAGYAGVRATPDDVVAAFQMQGFCCVMCGKPDSESVLCIDHDHNTGKFRGLLCRGCNYAVGVYETRKTQIVAYLELSA